MLAIVLNKWNCEACKSNDSGDGKEHIVRPKFEFGPLGGSNGDCSVHMQLVPNKCTSKHDTYVNLVWEAMLYWQHASIWMHCNCKGT